MNTLLSVLFLATLVSLTAAHCYDTQVAADQYFDDSFVVKETLTYPAQIIESDLNNLNNLDLLYFLDTSATCFNETGYFSKSYSAVGDYAYQCVCPSPRKRIEAVYVQKDICFVVYPEKQDVQYAQCRGHCVFDYKTQIATASRGYFCVHQSFVQREFLVWCPSIPATALTASGRVRRQVARPGTYQPFGRFVRVGHTLPTLCSCRGYFCDHHATGRL